MKAIKLLVIVCWSLFVACNEIPDCQLIDEVDYLQISFFDRDTSTLSETLIFESIIAEGADTLMANQDTLSTIRLYVNPSDTVSRYYLKSSIGHDTLVLKYQSKFRIESIECGSVQEITNLDTVYYTFDSLAIENSSLNRSVNANIKIFLD